MATTNSLARRVGDTGSDAPRTAYEAGREVSYADPLQGSSFLQALARKTGAGE